MVTRQEAQAALDAATAERDTIQANLLDLDNSFGKRLLSGAALTGLTKQQWDEAAAALAGLWDTYTAYSAVIDKAAGTIATARDRELAAVTALLSGRSVRLAQGPAPLARRDLADTGIEQLTLAAAIARMRRDFARVTAVVSAAEAVWGEVGGLLDQAGAELARVAAVAADLADDTLTTVVASVTGQLSAQRAALNSDPLALWTAPAGGQGGHADTAGASAVRRLVAGLAAEVDAVARVRGEARQRIEALATTAAGAMGAWKNAVEARQRAAAKISAGSLPAIPAAYPGTAFRRADLDALAAARQWQRLSAELDRAEQGLMAEVAAYRDAAGAADGALGRREELRGMLQAYKAKAARLGAAEDLGLTGRYEAARDLLWTAPCDLGAAAAAVAAYQQAILAIGRGQG
ncbi:MAG TPA: hypothetical protein VH478_23560 [Trebonia sp.]|jgi:hypothetical protein|nr:hypothetical protein [Trebonia sp.]